MYSRGFVVLAVSLTAEQVPERSWSLATSLFVAWPVSLMSPSPCRLTVAGRYVKRQRPAMCAYPVVAVSLLYASAHPYRFCNITTANILETQKEEDHPRAGLIESPTGLIELREGTKTGSEMKRWMDRKIDRQTDRQIDRQTDKEPTITSQ